MAADAFPSPVTPVIPFLGWAMLSEAETSDEAFIS